MITVAHRIPTVMDCNMVLGFSDGKLVEFDEPMKLMNKEGSLFGQLVQEYYLVPPNNICDRDQGGLSHTATAVCPSRLGSTRHDMAPGRGRGNTCLRHIRADTIFLEKILEEFLFERKKWKNVKDFN
ncbi:putative multidrug resistance-associated protein 1, 3 (mrp1, 3), abc-transoprter [Hibiscus syriacus]|uniref:Multidrug resistance-associated protein 1, 3 (Mrp1, 3), abc-transoprter n=1 Tax=Hibiscus syriacus TaxID=106335 RepID=A0A6A2X7B0_HIBSY|nr:putative multidrug resistance-associated protein 1, 3 (mrp1, 3), abc-transoprter [Hibiscus syriacus]